MKILYIGDIMGRMGRQTVQKVLPDLIKSKQIDFVIAQAENLSSGKGMRIEAIREMQAAGVDFFTGGNWSWAIKEIYPYLDDPSENIIRPANYPDEAPGRGYKVVETPFGKILVICVLGQIVGHSQPQVENPLRVIESILEQTSKTKLAATVIDFHGDFSSEKLVVGQYFDGRVTAAIGDHWHVPTADAMVLPQGTAHITDVGMVGSLDSCLGVKTEVIVDRWMTQLPSRNELETSGRAWFNAALIDVNPKTSLANNIEHISLILPD